MATHLLGDPVPASLNARYADLDAGRMEELLALRPFGEIETNRRVEHRSHDSLAAGFTRRGPRPYTHDDQLAYICTASYFGALDAGDFEAAADCFRSGTFISTLSLDGGVRIERHVGFWRKPAVGVR